MRPALILVLVACFGAQALADSYPVSGRWGQSESSAKGAIDCTGLRVIAFNGNQRTDSNGGVPAYRNLSVAPDPGGYRIVDEFNTAQINARAVLILKKIDDDHITLNLQPGGLLKLQRCK